MVFFVVEGSAGSRNNLPALGKEMYPLAFLAPVGNALLLPPPCWRGRASPNSPRDSRALAASKSCLAQTPPLGYTVRAALGGSPAATSLGNPGLEIGRNGAATPIGKGSVPKTVVVCFLGVELRGGLVFPLLWKLS